MRAAFSTAACVLTFASLAISLPSSASAPAMATAFPQAFAAGLVSMTVTGDWTEICHGAAAAVVSVDPERDAVSVSAFGPGAGCQHEYSQATGPACTRSTVGDISCKINPPGGGYVELTLDRHGAFYFYSTGVVLVGGAVPISYYMVGSLTRADL